MLVLDVLAAESATSNHQGIDKPLDQDFMASPGQPDRIAEEGASAMNTNISRGARIGLAATAIVSAAALTVGCSAASGSMADQIQPAAAHSTLGATGSDITVKRATMESKIVNNTGEDLTLVSASDGGGTGVHWQQHAKTILPANQSETVTNYSSLDGPKIDLLYKDTAGNTFTFDASDPMVTKDTVSGSASNSSYGVNAESGSGNDDVSGFTAYAGHAFGYTGSTQQYVVPAGVTKLNATVIGGSGGDYSGGGFGGPVVNGADVSGTLNVTPGEVLTIGVGGKGYQGPHFNGGWGMPWNGSSFSGGSGRFVGAEGGGGGGGASVIEADNQLQVVAGGAGGQGGSASYNDFGGKGGYNGSLTGQNGQNNGGSAGSMSTPQGQDSLFSNAGAVAGSGGGGYAGGASGQYSGQNGGGGAGSSYDNALNPGATVATASGGMQDGSITLNAVTS